MYINFKFKRYSIIVYGQKYQRGDLLYDLLSLLNKLKKYISIPEFYSENIAEMYVVYICVCKEMSILHLFFISLAIYQI